MPPKSCPIGGRRGGNVDAVSTSDAVVIRQGRTVGVFLALLATGPFGLLFLLSAPAVLISGEEFNGGVVIMFLLGLLMTALAVSLAYRAAIRSELARIDATGVTFDKIADPRLRSWSWAEIASISTRSTTVRGVTIDDLRFELYRSPRVDELRASLPARDVWFRSRDTRLGDCTSIRFGVGVRPRYGEVIARLGQWAPAGLVPGHWASTGG